MYPDVQILTSCRLCNLGEKYDLTPPLGMVIRYNNIVCVCVCVSVCLCVCVCVSVCVPLLDQNCPKALALCVAQAAPHCVWGHQGRVSGRHKISVVVRMREAPLWFREGSLGLEMSSNLEDCPGFSQPFWEQITPPLG